MSDAVAKLNAATGLSLNIDTLGIVGLRSSVKQAMLQFGAALGTTIEIDEIGGYAFEQQLFAALSQLDAAAARPTSPPNAIKMPPAATSATTAAATFLRRPDPWPTPSSGRSSPRAT